MEFEEALGVVLGLAVKVGTEPYELDAIKEVAGFREATRYFSRLAKAIPVSEQKRNDEMVRHLKFAGFTELVFLSKAEQGMETRQALGSLADTAELLSAFGDEESARFLRALAGEMAKKL